LAVALLVLGAVDRLSDVELALVLAWVFAAMAAVGELWNKGWGRGRLALATVVDLTYAPIMALVMEPGVKTYAWWALGLASAIATWWALSASKRR
jgi:hypothetical protein